MTVYRQQVPSNSISWLVRQSPIQFNLKGRYCSSKILYHEVLHSVASKTFPDSIIILHGLFGSAQNWRSLGKQLGLLLEQNVYALDLRNHGYSFHHPEMNYNIMANDVQHWMIKHNIPSATILGHSMVRYDMK